MLCNYGYDVKRCFDCPYGNGSHIPEDYEGWSCTVIKDTMVTKCFVLIKNHEYKIHYFVNRASRPK